jgi:hypothetical protein
VTEPAYVTVKPNGDVKGQGRSATNVTSAVTKFKEALLPLSPKEMEASSLPASPVKVMPQQKLGHQE